MYNLREVTGNVDAIWLGRRVYEEVWKLQREIHSRVSEASEKEKLLLVEHNPVITLGRRAQETNILLPQGELRRRGVEVFAIERGGDVTFHGPGQLVGYPILDLKKRGLSVSSYVRILEESLITLLKRYGIESYRRDGMIGVWTNAGKIAAIGVAVRRWVTFHGFALNVCTDLSYFNLIVPCGLAEPVTSIRAMTGLNIAPSDVVGDYIHAFRKTFSAPPDPAR